MPAVASSVNSLSHISIFCPVTCSTRWRSCSARQHQHVLRPLRRVSSDPHGAPPERESDYRHRLIPSYWFITVWESAQKFGWNEVLRSATRKWFPEGGT